MSGFVASELSAFCFGVEHSDFEIDSSAFPGHLRRTLRTGLHLSASDQDSVGIVACEFPWAIKDGQRVIEVAMYPNGGLDVVTPVPIGRDLEFFPIEGDAVVTSDASVMLFAQDIVEVGDYALDKGRPLFQGGLAEFSVVGGKVGLLDVPI